jgi:hypothetical protein
MYGLRFSPLVLLLLSTAQAQQFGDPEFVPREGEPRWAEGEGPSLVIDGAHGNFHSMDGRFAPFAAVLRADGCSVSPGEAQFTAESLADVDVLVISNALHPDNVESWALPTPSAFTEEEIEVLHQWVLEGGGLFLIADHMPFPGAAEDLAKEFGFGLRNGFAFPSGDRRVPISFTRGGGGIGDLPLTQGVDQVQSFTGQAFSVPEDSEVVLVLPEGVVSLEPEVAWEFTEETPELDVSGWAQGAILHVGKGRMAMFGEAAMFTSQVAGGDHRVGLRSPGAEGNEVLLKGIVRWLAGE